MPGLDHFIEQETDDNNSNSNSDDADSIENNNNISDNADDIRTDIDNTKSTTDRIDYNWRKHGTQVDHTAERNICPACLTSGVKADGYNRFWSCENDNCGTVMYGSGWFEQRRELWGSDDDFLTSIDWPQLMDDIDAKLDSQ